MFKTGAFAPFHLLNRSKVLILTYHRFSREAHPQTISAAEFSAHLEYLEKHNRVLPLAEVVENLQNGKALPPNTAVITIDDGYSDAYEIAFPILKKRNMPATVYGVTDFIDGKCWLWTDLMRFVLTRTKAEKIDVEFENERIEGVLKGNEQKSEIAGRINSFLKKMPNDEKTKKIAEIAVSLGVEIPGTPTEEYSAINWQNAQEMDAANVRIESHTVRHPILTNIAADELEFELKTSKSRLEEMLGRKAENFCYPNGTFNETVKTAVKNAGYRSAVSTRYGFNDGQENFYSLRRIDAPAGIANFAQSVSGFEAFRLRL